MHRAISHHCMAISSAKIGAAILSCRLFWVKTFLGEISFFHKEWDQSFVLVECASGADMGAESDSADVHSFCWMAEPRYQPVVETDFGVEENECVVASVDDCHMHGRVSGQVFQQGDNFLLLSDLQICSFGKTSLSEEFGGFNVPFATNLLRSQSMIPTEVKGGGGIMPEGTNRRPMKAQEQSKTLRNPKWTN